MAGLAAVMGVSASSLAKILGVSASTIGKFLGLDTVPTGDLCTGGTPSASGVSDGNAASRAFDDNYTTYWYYYGFGSFPQWIQYQLATSRAVKRYKLTNYPSGTAYAPTQWKFQGSNNGTDWTDLDTRTGISWASGGQTQEFSFSNSTAYAYYRLYIQASTTASQIIVTEIETFAV